MKAFKGVTVLVFICVCYASFKSAHGEFAQIGLKNYYIERQIRLNWYAAWNYCAVNKMNLFAVNTQLESILIRRYLNGTYLPFWTSGNELASFSVNKTDRKFVWANIGKPVTFTDWSVNEPDNESGNERCLAAAKGFKWVDSDCRALYFFICEY